MSASGLSGERALQVLRAALDKEQQQWRPIQQRPAASQQEITDMERDREAYWLVRLSQTFDFAPETYVLAVSIMDRVSTLVKIRPKYLRCVAISCLYIAAKTLEDDEAIPVTLDLVQKSQCGCSVSEVLRMEMVILSKLDWNPKAVTAIDFLHVIHALLMWRFPHLLTPLKDMTPSRHLAILTRKLFALLCHAELARHRPAVIALALVSLELEQAAPDHWFSINQTVQAAIQAENTEVTGCRERLARLLSQRGLLVTAYARKPAPATSAPKPKKRKVDEREAPSVQADDIYDGIKRLYEDSGGDKMAAILSKRGSCASEVHHDADDHHPFVHAVAAV